MKAYKLSVLPRFKQDLRETLEYIAFKLQNPDAAQELKNAVDQAIHARLSCAESFMPYRSEKSEHPYYKIFVRNFVILYVVIDDVMEVRRFLYKRRDMKRLI